MFTPQKKICNFDFVLHVHNVKVAKYIFFYVSQVIIKTILLMLVIVCLDMQLTRVVKSKIFVREAYDTINPLGFSTVLKILFIFYQWYCQ